MTFKEGDHAWYWHKNMENGPVSVTITSMPVTDSGYTEIEVKTTVFQRYVIVSINNLYTYQEVRLMEAVGLLTLQEARP